MESIQSLRPRQLEILQLLATELSICIWDLVTDPESLTFVGLSLLICERTWLGLDHFSSIHLYHLMSLSFLLMTWRCPAWIRDEM